MRRFARYAPVLVALAALAGCDGTFEPFEEADVAFSLFGYLDVAADTQFVRVGALRSGAFADAPVEAVVTLEDVETGETVTLRDSVVRFGNGATVHNFWTTMPLAHEATYRLTVTPLDGDPAATASALIETPPPFPTPEFESGISQYSSPEFPPTAQSMAFSGVEQMADLRITYVIEEPEMAVVVSYLDRLQRSPQGLYSVAFNAYADVQRAISGSAGEACPRLRAAHVFAAAATDAWPNLLDLDPETLALPSTVTNVEGGIGYVGGVETKRGTWGSMVGVFGFHHAGCAE